MPAVNTPVDPAKKRLQDLDKRQLERVFGRDGFLAKAMAESGRTFEPREEQLEMALAVTRAIRGRAHLLVEAGTGTGKSYAYLIPFLLWAIEKKKRVLVATGTKALQQQLVERDLPFIAELFRTRFGHEVKFALCMGTGNYVCPRRLAKSLGGNLFTTQTELNQLAEINLFARKSETGRGIDLPFEPRPAVWSQVNRESDLCLGRACPLYEKSFFFKARREQENANILVANHHMLFAHLGAGGNAGGVLPAFDAIIIDEAHQIEDVAASYLGHEISNLGAARLIELISNRRTNRTVLQGAKFAEAEELEKLLVEAAIDAREAVERFFENLQLAIAFDPDRSSNIRIRQKGIVENCLSEPLLRLEDILEKGRRYAQRDSEDVMERELEGYAGRCNEMRFAAQIIVNQSKEGFVYWLACSPRPSEAPGRPTRVPRLSLHGAPVEVAALLQEDLFGAYRPIVLTSATLTTGGSFEFLKERLGLSDAQLAQPGKPKPPAIPRGRPFAGAVPPWEDPADADEDDALPRPEEPFDVRTLAIGSPFDYRRNTLLYVAGDLPDPSHAEYWEQAAMARLAEVLKRTDGRAFVLCTSFRIVDRAARELTDSLPRHIRVMRQGELPKGQLLREFREDTHSVLVGTTSFWQGVDVPGDSLSCVVIMKLPFAVPDEPLVSARVETLKARGRNAFAEYQVPQAVMMFRQGFGRLIRTAEDRGVVAVLDPRVRTKPYGRTFLQSLPECNTTEDLNRIASFWRQP